jgi:type I restriction enzyme S subunit
MVAVERARASAEAQLQTAENLPSAYLRAVFISPEAQAWPIKRLKDVCEIQLGKMLSPKSRTGLRPRPYLRNANVQWNRFDLSGVLEMDFSEVEERKFALRRGDLLVCEGGEPGRSAVWQGEIEPCFFQKALHRLRPIQDRVNPSFVMHRLWLGANESEFSNSHAKTTIAHLPAVRLAELEIGVPPLSDQRRIAAQLSSQMASAERLRQMLTEQLDAINKLPAALLRRAFNGEV